MIGFANLENSLGVSPFLLAARLAARAESERRGRARMDHTLKHLLGGTTVLAWRGDADRPVTSLVTDSRRVVPGALFFAIEGARVNGADYVEEAIGRGAVAVVSARAPGAAFARRRGRRCWMCAWRWRRWRGVFTATRTRTCSSPASPAPTARRPWR